MAETDERLDPRRRSGPRDEDDRSFEPRDETSSESDDTPSESSRSLMFGVLVVVMASAPTYVSLRAIRANRASDFPLGDSLGNAAVVLFAVAAIALLSVCFWPSMTTATWGAPTTGTMLGAAGVVMACIGSTHAVAGIIGTGFLSEPAWLGWLVLIGVYPLAGKVASRFAREYIGEPIEKPDKSKRSRPAGSGDPSDPDRADDDAPYTRERSFGDRSRGGPRDQDRSDGWDDHDDWSDPDDRPARRDQDRPQREDRDGWGPRDNRHSDDRYDRDPRDRRYPDDRYDRDPRDRSYPDDRYDRGRRDDPRYPDDRYGRDPRDRGYRDDSDRNYEGRARQDRPLPAPRPAAPIEPENDYADDPFADPVYDGGYPEYEDGPEYVDHAAGYDDDAEYADDGADYDDDPFADYED